MSTPAENKYVCPYCGLAAPELPNPCPRCAMRDNPNTRAATTARVGPWFVLNDKNPGAPGMNFATLLSLVRRGQVTPDSVVRGPTTQQLWARASKVKGLSREFSLCWSCDQPIDRGTNLCPHCQKMQEPPIDPNVLIEGQRPTRDRERPATPAASPPKTPAGELGLAGASLPTGPSKQSRILSPKELAAAFALETPADVTAPPTTTAPAPSPAPHGRGINIPLLLLLVAAAGAVAYAAFNPAARGQVSAKLADLRTWAEAHLSQPVPPDPSPPRPVAKPSPVPASSALPATRPTTAPVAKPRTDPPVTAPPPPIIQTITPKPSTRPAPPRATVVIGPPADFDESRLPPATQAAIRVEPARPIPQPPAPQPPKAADPPRPAADPPKTETVVAVTPEMSQRAIDLFRQALEAESRNDYAGAVKLYEQIKTLPKPAWPASLERRLTSAQLRAGGDGL